MTRLEAAVSELVEALREELAAGDPPAHDRLLDVTEAAQLLGIGRTALYGELQAGRIESIVIGERSRRIPQSAIDRYIAKGVAE